MANWWNYRRVIDVETLRIVIREVYYDSEGRIMFAAIPKAPSGDDGEELHECYKRMGYAFKETIVPSDQIPHPEAYTLDDALLGRQDSDMGLDEDGDIGVRFKYQR